MSPSNSDWVLNAEHLRKSFTVHTLGGKEIEGFPEVSFSVNRSGSLALSGPSGSGKSSVLKCIHRTYKPSGGRIRYRSEEMGVVDLARATEHEILRLRHREIGYITQFLNELPRVSAVDVVAQAAVDQFESRSAARERAAELLGRLSIPSGLFDAFPATFSGGERQRVNIARAVISRPRLLLLDEPTSSLDSGSVTAVVDLLQELRDAGTTMVMVFHDDDMLEVLADEVFTMPRKEPARVCR
jgi:alpha-D-ribose 1-methylphosphonate 5-triphosphate synthase subunit PhnL